MITTQKIQGDRGPGGRHGYGGVPGPKGADGIKGGKGLPGVKGSQGDTGISGELFPPPLHRGATIINFRHSRSHGA